MSQRLSTSATFQSLEARVISLELTDPLPSTLENNTYLSAKRSDGVLTRISGINSSNILYFGGLDFLVNSLILSAGPSAPSIELNSTTAKVWGPLEVSSVLKASVITAPSANGTGGGVQIIGSGVAGYTGVVQFHKLDGTRNGVIGFNAENGPMHYGSDTGTGHFFEGGIISPDPNMHFGLRFNGVDGVIDFDSGGDALSYSRSANAYAFNVAGTAAATIDGTGIATPNKMFPGADPNFYAGIVSSQPRILWDATDSLQYDRTGDALTAYIGGSAQLTINPSGTFVANVLTVGDSNFALSIPVANKPQITFDTGGDQIVYDRTANKYYFVIGGVNVASIDASGNLRIKGALSQGVTP